MDGGSPSCGWPTTRRWSRCATSPRPPGRAGGGGRRPAGRPRPRTPGEGWWLAILWVADAGAVVPRRDLAPAAGPPADPPLARLGPSFAGALSGMILEENGRLSIRLATVVPADDATRPWRVPAAIRAGFKFEPMRAAAMTPNQLADAVLAGFRRSAEGLSRP